ncbi:MAG: hypothetical protein IIC10_10210, partial [Proteobacteria bacterium]|nr:hypothetical protein [Pseudomonadota bacterium]
MLFLIKIFPEISIKSRPVRKRFIRQLRKNIRAVIRPLERDVTVTGEWDIIEVRTGAAEAAVGQTFEMETATREEKELRTNMVEQLIRIPGIALVGHHAIGGRYRNLRADLHQPARDCLPGELVLP